MKSSTTNKIRDNVSGDDNAEGVSKPPKISSLTASKQEKRRLGLRKRQNRVDGENDQPEKEKEGSKNLDRRRSGRQNATLSPTTAKEARSLSPSRLRRNTIGAVLSPMTKGLRIFSRSQAPRIGPQILSHSLGHISLGNDSDDDYSSGSSSSSSSERDKDVKLSPGTSLAPSTGTIPEILSSLQLDTTTTTATPTATVSDTPDDDDTSATVAKAEQRRCGAAQSVDPNKSLLSPPSGGQLDAGAARMRDEEDEIKQFEEDLFDTFAKLKPRRPEGVQIGGQQVSLLSPPSGGRLDVDAARIRDEEDEIKQIENDLFDTFAKLEPRRPEGVQIGGQNVSLLAPPSGARLEVTDDSDGMTKGETQMTEKDVFAVFAKIEEERQRGVETPVARPSLLSPPSIRLECDDDDAQDIDTRSGCSGRCDESMGPSETRPGIQFSTVDKPSKMRPKDRGGLEEGENRKKKDMDADRDSSKTSEAIGPLHDDQDSIKKELLLLLSEKSSSSTVEKSKKPRSMSSINTKSAQKRHSTTSIRKSQKPRSMSALSSSPKSPTPSTTAITKTNKKKTASSSRGSTTPPRHSQEPSRSSTTGIDMVGPGGTTNSGKSGKRARSFAAKNGESSSLVNKKGGRQKINDGGNNDIKIERSDSRKSNRRHSTEQHEHRSKPKMAEPAASKNDTIEDSQTPGTGLEDGEMSPTAGTKASSNKISSRSSNNVRPGHVHTKEAKLSPQSTIPESTLKGSKVRDSKSDQAPREAQPSTPDSQHPSNNATLPQQSPSKTKAQTKPRRRHSAPQPIVVGDSVIKQRRGKKGNRHANSPRRQESPDDPGTTEKPSSIRSLPPPRKENTRQPDPNPKGRVTPDEQKGKTTSMRRTTVKRRRFSNLEYSSSSRKASSGRILGRKETGEVTGSRESTPNKPDPKGSFFSEEKTSKKPVSDRVSTKGDKRERRSSGVPKSKPKRSLSLEEDSKKKPTRTRSLPKSDTPENKEPTRKPGSSRSLSPAEKKKSSPRHGLQENPNLPKTQGRPLPRRSFAPVKETLQTVQSPKDEFEQMRSQRRQSKANANDPNVLPASPTKTSGSSPGNGIETAGNGDTPSPILPESPTVGPNDSASAVATSKPASDAPNAIEQSPGGNTRSEPGAPAGAVGSQDPGASGVLRSPAKEPRHNKLIQKELKKTRKLIKRTIREVLNQQDEIEGFQRQNWSIRKSLIQSHPPEDPAATLQSKIELLKQQGEETDRDIERMQDEKAALEQDCLEVTERIELFRGLLDDLNEKIGPLLPKESSAPETTHPPDAPDEMEDDSMRSMDGDLNGSPSFHRIGLLPQP